MPRIWLASLAVIAATLLASAPAELRGQPNVEAAPIGDADFGGVVTSANGPEAGVWSRKRLSYPPNLPKSSSPMIRGDT